MKSREGRLAGFILGDRKRHVIPQAEGAQPVAAAQPCRCACTSVAKEVTDFGIGEEKALSAAHAPKASLLPLLLPSGTMALLNQVVLALGCRYGHVLARAQIRYALKGRAITPEPIRDDTLRYVPVAKRPSEKALAAVWPRSFCGNASSTSPCSFTARYS